MDKGKVLTVAREDEDTEQQEPRTLLGGHKTAHPFGKVAACTYDVRQILLYDPASTPPGIYGEMKNVCYYKHVFANVH